MGVQMRLKAVRVKNFRGYKNSGWIKISGLTGLVGKNDCGKSSILDALELFFAPARKFDEGDLRKSAPRNAVAEIACEFDDLPKEVCLDNSESTTLQDEFLVDDSGDLVVVKRYAPNQKAEVFVWCKHPSNPVCSDLLKEKDAKLRAIIENKNVSCKNKASNVEMRKCIRSHFKDSLKVGPQEISLKSDMEAKLLECLPKYYLFKADRDNTEEDAVIRKPINDEIHDIIKRYGLQSKLNEIADNILKTLKDLMGRTLTKMKELDIPLACDLKPYIPDLSKLKWAEVFKDVSLVGDDEIPLEKRGSGVRRLVLLSFLRAAKEQPCENGNGLIYAIEEPETAQHFDNQRKLLQSLRRLAETGSAQVIVTTHCSNIVKEIGIENIHVITKTDERVRIKKPRLLLPDRLGESLNYVAYRVFGECKVEYHNELYGYLEALGLNACCGNEYIARFGTREWNRNKDGVPITEHKSLCYYVRNSIHHPENENNSRPTEEDIDKSIKFMEDFLKRHRKAVINSALSKDSV